MDNWIHSVGDDWDIRVNPDGTEWKGWFQMSLFVPGDVEGTWQYDDNFFLAPA